VLTGTRGSIGGVTMVVVLACCCTGEAVGTCRPPSPSVLLSSPIVRPAFPSPDPNRVFSDRDGRSGWIVAGASATEGVQQET